MHGDNFTSCGSAAALKRLKKEFESRFEITAQVVGPDPGQQKQFTILLRVLRWEVGRIDYEPDQRHVEIAMRELGLSFVTPVTTLSTREELLAASTPCIEGMTKFEM